MHRYDNITDGICDGVDRSFAALILLSKNYANSENAMMGKQVIFY